MLSLFLALLTVAGVSQAATAQSSLATKSQGGWIGSFDYLSWSVRSSDLEYGITDIGGVQDRGPVGEILTLDPSYDSGFRFAIGRSGVSGPEVLFEYTTFDTASSETYVGPLRATFVSSDNSENDDSDNINTLGVETITPDDRATSATAEMTFDYEIYDIEMAQSLTLTDTLQLRLSGGGRIASIDSSFNVQYTGGDFQTAFNSFKESAYEGGGITAGGDLVWQLMPSIRLSVGTNVAMMMGTVDTRVFIPDDEPGVPTDVEFSDTRMTPVLTMSAGLDMQRQIGSFLVGVAGGYEMTNWFNLTDTRVFSDSHIEAQNSHLVDDLSLDGAYVRFFVMR
ncbi:MAG: Lpg1974 family pore-forming outer membrane protein [Planctomycetota bacterium]